MIRSATATLVLGLLVWPASAATLDGRTAAPALDELLEEFEASTPEPEGSVRLDAWVEPRGEGRELVVVVEPEGKTKLVADPGITLTPDEESFGVTWQVALPHRMVDSGTDYWEGQRALRVPFEAAEGTPLEFRVEYAWCVVDYQCFFGEETLSVANRIN